jgi:hypothetical protein
MPCAPDHMRDRHFHIVNHNGKIVCRPTIGSQDHEVTEVAPRNPDFTTNSILELNLARPRHWKP